MNYCSACGEKVALQWIEQDQRHRHVCGNCGATYYQNPRIIVSCGVYWTDKVLMCRRAVEPGLGLWAVPSGYLESGETLEQGAARETYEESGVIIDPNRLHLRGVVNMTAIDQVAIMFRVEVTEKPLAVPGPECSEVGFFSLDEIPPDQLAWRSTMGDAPERARQELRSREFTIQLVTLAAGDGTGFRSREYTIESVHDTVGDVNVRDR